MIKKEDIVLIGGGGHCKACIDVIEAEDKFKIAGIVDAAEKKGSRVLGHEIFASDDDLPFLAREYKNFLIAVGQIKSPDKRRSLFNAVKALDIHFPVIISPYAYVSKHAAIGEGTIIMHGVFVNAGVKIGKNCILNTSSVVEHDSFIEDHCHISTGSVINGACHVGEGVLIGSNGVISNNLDIAENTVVGAGSVVIDSIEESGTYAGTPARRIK